MKPYRLLIIIGVLFTIFTAPLMATQSHLLAPPDTSSPRATLQTFLGIMKESRSLMEQDPYLESDALQLHDEQLEEQTELLFDFRDTAVERVEDIANYASPLLAR